MFNDKCNDIVSGQYNTKTLYNLVLDNDEHVIKIVERNVNIDSNMTSPFPFVKKNRIISSYYLISTCADECD